MKNGLLGASAHSEINSSFLNVLWDAMPRASVATLLQSNDKAGPERKVKTKNPREAELG